MLDFWRGASHCDDSKGRSPSSPVGGTAPPRTRRTRALASSAVRSARTVTADTPNRPARSVTRANPSSQMIPAMRAWRTSASGLSSETPPPAGRSPICALLWAHCERLPDACQVFGVVTVPQAFENRSPGRAAAQAGPGGMFWLRRNRLPGS